MIAYTEKDGKKYFVAQGEPGEIWQIVTDKLVSLKMHVVIRYLDGDKCPENWGYLEELIK